MRLNERFEFCDILILLGLTGMFAGLYAFKPWLAFCGVGLLVFILGLRMSK